jgi:hypothetical protein
MWIVSVMQNSRIPSDEMAQTVKAAADARRDRDRA